jgi:hypothetical protein
LRVPNQMAFRRQSYQASRRVNRCFSAQAPVVLADHSVHKLSHRVLIQASQRSPHSCHEDNGGRSQAHVHRPAPLIENFRTNQVRRLSVPAASHKFALPLTRILARMLSLADKNFSSTSSASLCSSLLSSHDVPSCLIRINNIRSMP